MPTKTQPRIIRDILQRHAADLVMQLSETTKDPQAARKINVAKIVNAMESACVEAMTKCCDMVFDKGGK